jgi:uncharacterized protein
MKKQTMLWRIEGETLPGPSFLFGTMHVRDSRMFDDIEVVCEKIRHCQAFALEFNLEEAATQNPDSFSLQLSEGQSLLKLIPPQKYQKLRKILLKSALIDIDYFQNAPPFLIVNLIADHILIPDMPDSLDEFLWNFAKQQDKSMFGVETFEEQLKVLEKITFAEQVKMLLEMARNVGRYRKQLLHMASLYQKRDVQRLFKTVKKNSKGLRKVLLYNRNEIMAERIAALAMQQTTFAAIGAAHLGGGKGVIKLLKMRGLKLYPVENPFI